ncbi:MAG: DUF308 domain-containing protein [Pseudomonadota bacterium]|jgi:hypothetical protein
MILLLIAGIAAFMIGIFALAYGIPIKEFSFGNTMIVTGAIIASAGLLLIGLWIVGRELRALAQRLLAADLPALPRGEMAAPVIPPRTSEPEPVVTGDLAAPPRSDEPPAPPPWAEPEPPAAVEPPPPPAPAPPKRRNLLFSSSSRKERERAAAKAAEQAPLLPEAATTEPALAEPTPEPAAAPPPADVDPRASFEAAWPQAERARPGVPLRRDPSPSEPAAPAPASPPPRVRPDPKPVASEVTILKSGVVDGMAYSLYSDGSIEAQMPEGMVRFASIDELRAHLDQRT